MAGENINQALGIEAPVPGNQGSASPIQSEDRSSIASVLVWLGIINIVAGLIMGIIVFASAGPSADMLRESYNYEKEIAAAKAIAPTIHAYGGAIFASGIVGGILFLALARVITLLTQIRDTLTVKPMTKEVRQ